MRALATSLCLVACAATAAAQALDFQAAAAYSEARNGHALLAWVDGKLVFERYANGWSAAQPHRLASGTKSFSGVLAAMAIEDGLLKGLDEKLADTLTEWRADARKARITYRQLLGLTSGLSGGTVGQAPPYASAIHYPTIADPDRVFSYGPVPFQAFGEALKRKLAPRETVADYLKRRLLDPFGIAPARWPGFAQGEPQLPGGVWLRADEWVRFGEMVRLGGFWQSRRLVRQDLLDACFVPGPVEPTYGVSWWLAAATGTGPKDMVAAMGAGKQRLYVVRSLDLVLVRFGESGPSFDDDGLFAALMPAAVEMHGRGCGGPAGVPALTASPPRIAASWPLALASLPASAPGAVFVGASRASWGAVPLPLDLAFLGAPGCSLLVAPDASLPFVASGGVATLPLVVPADVGLVRETLHLQGLALEPRANSPGLVFSAGLSARFGPR